MISVRLGNPTDAGTKPWGALVLPVVSTPQGPSATPPPDCADEVSAFLADEARAGDAGRVSSFSRPLRDPSKIVLVGAGSGDSKGWRKAGGALARAARDAEVTVLGMPPEAVAAFAEGLWLGEYTF